MNNSSVIVLTGGPGGGKTTLINELVHGTAWHGKIATLPEAISLMGGIGISPRERLFQRVMVQMQMSLEDGVIHAFEDDDQRLVLCHRGSLDPLAYWIDRGWAEDEFFSYTRTVREHHYRRYAAVIHLVTSADGAEQAYRHWPEAHRPEMAEDAIRIDQLLQRVWSEHPNYHRIDNVGRDWIAKSREATMILKKERKDR